jgi:hypothetical protein
VHSRLSWCPNFPSLPLLPHTPPLASTSFPYLAAPCLPHTYTFSRTSNRPFSGPCTPVIFSYWFALLVKWCWRFHSIRWTSQWELGSSRPLTFCFLYKLGLPSGGLFCLPPACLLVSYWNYFFDSEDGGDMFLRNVGWHSADYTALYPRSWYSSKFLFLSQFYNIPKFSSRSCLKLKVILVHSY